MPSRTPGDPPDPAAELLGRWQAHHSGTVDPSADDEAPGEHLAETPPTSADQTQPDPSSTHDVPAPDEDASETGTEPESGEVEPSGPAPKHAAPRSTHGQRRPPSPRGADHTEAGREVIEALGITPPEPAPPALVAAGAAPAGPRRPREPARPPGTTTDVEFAPRLALRRILGWTLLALLPLIGGAGIVAYDQRETLPIGILGTLVVLFLIIYAIRVGSTPARLAIHSGQLEVIRGNTREVFDLTSRFTRLEIVGKPGRPGWKVLMARFGRDPLVIDSSMVDPAVFTAALERHRPQSR